MSTTHTTSHELDATVSAATSSLSSSSSSSSPPAPSSSSSSSSSSSPALPPLSSPSHHPHHLSLISFNMLAPPYKRCQANVVNATPACYPTPVTPACAAACAASASSPPPAGPIMESGTNYSASPPPSPFPTSRYRESSRPEEWRTRVGLIIAALKQTEADIICLEEYWTAGKEFCELMEEAFCKPSAHHPAGPLYSLYTAPRTGGKDDGIAILLRRASKKGQIDLSVVRDWNFSLTGFGNRVGKLLQVEGRLLQEDVAVTTTHAQQPVLNRSHSSHSVEFHSWSWKDQFHAQLYSQTTVANGSVSHQHHAPPACVKFHFLLLVTHLTFPHGFFDAQQRKYEIGSLIQQLDNVRNSEPNPSASSLPLRSLPVVLTGDFNTCVADASLDYVYSYTVKRGFSSTFAIVNSREPGATHFNHRKECVPVDFIFLKSAKTIAEEQKQNGSNTCSAGPAMKPNLAAASLHNPTCAIDLRPVYSSLLPLALPHTFWPSFSDFKLSDHRPLLTVFDVEGLPTSSSMSTSPATSITVGANGDTAVHQRRPSKTMTEIPTSATASQAALVDGNNHASSMLKPNVNDRSAALPAAQSLTAAL